MGSIGVTGTAAANESGGRGGPDHRHRHAPGRFHHRVMGAVPATRRGRLLAINVCGFRRGQAPRRRVRGRCARDAGPNSDRALDRLDSARRTGRRKPRPRAILDRKPQPAIPRPSNTALPSDAQVIGAVQRAAASEHDVLVCAAGGLPGELHKHWQAGAAGRLSPGIWLFHHGLRDRRRAGRQDGRPVARRHGDGRRRLLSDDEFRDRHLGAARAEADDRGAGQSRLRLHRPAAALRGRGGLQQPARRYAACRPCRRSISPLTREALARMARRSPGLANWSRPGARAGRPTGRPSS